MPDRFSDEVESVFEQLLAEWRQLESRRIIGEWGVNITEDEAEADRVEQAWLERFYAARRLEGRIYEGDDSEESGT